MWIWQPCCWYLATLLVISGNPDGRSDLQIDMMEIVNLATLLLVSGNPVDMKENVNLATLLLLYVKLSIWRTLCYLATLQNLDVIAQNRFRIQIRHEKIS